MGASCICKKQKMRNQLLLDIKNITGETRSKNFLTRCGFNMEFKYSRRSNKIHCIFYKLFECPEFDSEGIEKIENPHRVDFKLMKVEVTKFYKFYNIVMNCLPIFSENEFKKNFQITSTGEIDETLCVICYERKSDHNFCEPCLKNWLPRNATKCPMCRKQVINNYDESSNFDLSDRRWSFIEKTEVNCQDYLNDLDEMFVNAMTQLIS